MKRVKTTIRPFITVHNAAPGEAIIKSEGHYCTDLQNGFRAFPAYQLAFE